MGHPQLTPEEFVRYSRHVLLPEFGIEGQARLKAGRVLIVGAGGLGSPAALYLAAAGVGTLGLVDFDEVDETNLQRQILYGTKDVGKPKLEMAAARLRDLNPHLRIECHDEPFSAGNALRLVQGYDVVLDGTDNFGTRYLVNDACVLAGKPNVYGSVFRFEGQASVFAVKPGPCYRCLHPEPPPPGLIPNCAEGGVLGVLPGLIGTIQATEAIKLMAGVGEPLVGKLLLYDALRLRFRQITLPRDPDCQICGDRPTIREVVDIGASCAPSPDVEIPKDPMFTSKRRLDDTDLSVEEYRQWRQEGRSHFLLDVREPSENEAAAIEGGLLIPLRQVPANLDKVPKDQVVVVYCRSGNRSGIVAAMMRGQGFDARNLAGGIIAWQQAGGEIAD